MTTIQTRANYIAELEGFNIVITKDGMNVDPTLNGVIGHYDYKKMAINSMTVANWRDRFEGYYPGYSCNVLLADGSVATGQMKLLKVRETYKGE